jgi:hypothetical protein
MKKSIGRTLAHIDVAANTSVRIHEGFFNSHSSYHHLSQTEIGSDNPCSRQLSGSRRKIHAKCLIPHPSSAAQFPAADSSKSSVEAG